MAQPLRRFLSGAAVLAALASGIIFTAPAASAATAVRGVAWGVSAQNIVIFGGAQKAFGPRPQVMLPSAGSATTITSADASENVVYGPATLWSSGTTAAHVWGTPARNSAQAWVTIAAATQPAGTCPGTSTSCIYGGPFTASSMSITCTANGTNSVAITINGGQVVTATDTSGNPTTTVAVPVHPAANYRVTGYLYISATDKETFVWVFNSQHTNSDGSLTSIAAQEILQGPTAKGNLYAGAVTCGLT